MPYHFIFTPEIVLALQSIEAARTKVQMVVLPPTVAEGLRLRARIRSTHFSTRIEGNRLNLMEAEEVLIEGREFPGRERDTLEVQHYFQALAQIEDWVEQGVGITEDRIRQLHALIYKGKRSRPTPYRDGQNVIRDSAGGLVYLPPEAKDVPALMSELVAWIQTAEKDQPIPVVAGIAHYVFVTVHPYFDGNGRTARALATWILYRGGYDLGRFYALEEFYAQDLEGYYDALVTHPDHNYYEGRNTADITPWLAYFVKGMASVFDAVARDVVKRAIQTDGKTDALLRKLDRRARIALGLFSRQDQITANDVARVLNLSTRQSRDLLYDWVTAGWLEMTSASRKSRAYQLSAEYRQFIGGITAVAKPNTQMPGRICQAFNLLPQEYKNIPKRRQLSPFLHHRIPMKTLFQTTIEHLLKSHNQLEAFHNAQCFHVRFVMPPYNRLVVERYDDLISVAHYFEQKGDLVPDPDVELHYPSWVPTAITQCIGIRRQKFIERDGKQFVDRHFHNEVSSFLTMWARNITAQGWAEKAKVQVDDA